MIALENLNRIVIWNFLKHFWKDLNCLLISFDCRYFLEYILRVEIGAGIQEREGLAFPGL